MTFAEVSHGTGSRFVEQRPMSALPSVRATSEAFEMRRIPAKGKTYTESKCWPARVSKDRFVSQGEGNP